MYKAYKFRIYPNKAQEQQIEQTFGNCRFVYNYYLNKRIELYRETKSNFNSNSCSKDLTQLKKLEEYKWLNLTDSTAYQNALGDLQNGYDKFFKEHTGFPKFKRKNNSYQSYTSKNNTNKNNTSSIRILDNNHIQLPKLKKVKCRISRVITGRIVNATISKVPSGKYFVSICCKEDIQPKMKTGSVVGLDLGIKEFCIDSNGSKIDNPKYLRKSEKKLARLQRQLSRKSIGSKNRNKARIKVAKCYEHITNQRKDFLQKLSTQIISENDIICLEDLNVKGMVKNHHLAKSISDCSWSAFTRMLLYKADWYDKKIVKIDRFFPSSKTCSCCGHRIDKMPLNIREWDCPECNTHHDRDINAAINILNEGLKLV